MSDEAWVTSTLPGCFGHPCEIFKVDGRLAYVWQASMMTTGGVWCWAISGGDIHVTKGNRGVAKSAARRALQKEIE